MVNPYMQLNKKHVYTLCSPPSDVFLLLIKTWELAELIQNLYQERIHLSFLQDESSFLEKLLEHTFITVDMIKKGCYEKRSRIHN